MLREIRSFPPQAILERSGAILLSERWVRSTWEVTGDTCIESGKAGPKHLGAVL